MTLHLELKPETEARLRENAAHAGVEEAEYAGWLIEEGLRDWPMSGAEALTCWERMGVRGVFAHRADSPELARRWRAQEEALTVRVPPEEAASDS